MKIGAKIKRLRLKLGLTQEELGDRCELSKGFISLLERDLTSPSIATLKDILECLGTDLPTFFSEKTPEKIVFSEADASVKQDEDGRFAIRWLIPGAQVNRMEPILVEIEPGGETAEQDPHEGEEFGYVIQGAATVVLGDQRARARRGESFSFESTAIHKLINSGKGKCVVLWVSDPPSF